MPSTLFDALNGSCAAPARSGIDQNFMARLGQFKNMMAPLMNGANPQAVAQAILAQRGYTPAQIQQMFQQFSAQATEIQKQLTGG